MNRLALFVHNLAHWLHGTPLRPLAWVFVLFNRVVFSCYIGAGARLGRGVKLGYGGLGVIIHGRAVLGDDVVLGGGVVIGGRSKEFAVPVIGDRCVIAAGAKVLGPITLGDESVVGANAVVIQDVPARCVVGGIPARVLKHDIAIEDYHDGVGDVAGPRRPASKARAAG